MSQSGSKNKGQDRAPSPAKAFDPNGVIGRKLKSFYDVIETEPVPDTLLDLLEKLDEAERKTQGNG